MAQSKHTGRTCAVLKQSGLVIAFLATAGTARLDQSAHGDGPVRCWGSGTTTAGGYVDYGQSIVPANLGDCSAVSAGRWHSVALQSDRTVRCWGAGTTNSGQLPNFGQSRVPDSLGQCSSVAGGGYHSIAIRIDGTVQCWGSNSYGQCAPPVDLGACAKIAGGFFHSVALQSNGIVRCWGDNGYGQCSPPTDIGPCSSIAAGFAHTMAIRSDGVVRCWGNNSYGQSVAPIDLGQCSSVACGWWHSVALQSNGTVRCWGDDTSGQCTITTQLGPCVSVAGGGSHSIAIQADGNARCWGRNQYGQCIAPTFLGSCSNIAAGEFHTVAISNLDCDGNGISDANEIVGHDCNHDYILDTCNAAHDTIEDCNNNGLGDACEKELTLALNSSKLSPIGFNANQTWTIHNAVRAESPVTLRIHGHGDFGGLQEYVRVRAGSGFDEHAVQNTNDCESGGGTPSVSTFTLTPEQFNAAIGADGSFRVLMEPSIAVDPAGCNANTGGTWIEASLDYIGALPADCNANGLLDSCEIAAGYSPDSNQNGVVDTCESLLLDCPTDFNQSGSTDGADLGILLAAWGATGQLGVDLNHDGIINGADLGALLADWGLCAN